MKMNYILNQVKYNNFLSEINSFPRNKSSDKGIIYTLYSDQLNLIELGFAKNNKIISERTKENKFILLDKKYGKFFDLLLLKKTLKFLNIELLNDKYCNYSCRTIRHLKTLGWPIGNSLYKKRIIRKKISYVF